MVFIFPSEISRSLKLYRARSDDYSALETSPTFRKNVSSFHSTSGSRSSDTITPVVHTSRVTKQRNRFNFSLKIVTRVKFSLTPD
jgi:hypothetical protein